jgi:hypothetical protein
MQLDERSTRLCDLEKKLQRPEIRTSPDEVARLLADATSSNLEPRALSGPDNRLSKAFLWIKKRNRHVS